MILKLNLLSKILLLFIIFSGSFYFGFKILTHSIYNQKTCEWANVDNIEMHTSINIPKIKTCDCKYIENQNSKIATFEINSKQILSDNYIIKNNFKKWEPNNTIKFDINLKLKSNFDRIKNDSEIYYNTGATKNEYWQSILDLTSGNLYIIIFYSSL